MKFEAGQIVEYVGTPAAKGIVISVDKPLHLRVFWVGSGQIHDIHKGHVRPLKAAYNAV
jgi:hypothetical protein